MVLNQSYVKCAKMRFNLVALNMPRGKLRLKCCQKKKGVILFEKEGIFPKKENYMVNTKWWTMVFLLSSLIDSNRRLEEENPYHYDISFLSILILQFIHLNLWLIPFVPHLWWLIQWCRYSKSSNLISKQNNSASIYQPIN